MVMTAMKNATTNKTSEFEDLFDEVREKIYLTDILKKVRFYKYADF